MKKDNSPVKQTCPEINNASNTINSVIDKMGDLQNELLALDDGLEILRTENADLRTWGNEQNDRAEELEKELSRAEKEIKEAKMEIIELLNDIKKLDEINMKLITEQAQ